MARYNAAAQNAQAAPQLHTSVLMKAKGEILRVIETLIDKLPNDVADLLTEVSSLLYYMIEMCGLTEVGGLWFRLTKVGGSVV